jgi:hypothetical protein
MRRRLFAVAGFVAGALAAVLAYRRSLGRGRDRLDLYFDDGSMVTLVEGAPDADRLLSVARDLLAAARS